MTSIGVQQDQLGQVQSLVRAFGILNVLRDAPDGLTLTQLAAATGLPRSTAHRLLATMNAMHYVEFDAETNRWLVGLQAFALGASFVQTRDIARLSRPIMRSIMMDVGETVNIGIATPRGLLYIAQVSPGHDHAVAPVPGNLLPIAKTASGKVLMAFPSFDDQRVDAGPAHARLAPDLLQRVKNAGFAVDDQEHRAGVRCVAAPIVNRQGHARLSLSISGNMRRMPDGRLDPLGKLLANAARRMSRELGQLLAA